MENGKGIPIYGIKHIDVLQLNGKFKINFIKRIAYNYQSHFNGKRGITLEAKRENQILGKEVNVAAL